MREYGKLASSMWTRGSGKRLRGHPVAQTLGAYLVSSSASNMIGLYHLVLATAAAEIGQPIDAVREAFAKCAEVGFAFFDEEAELVWVPNVAGIEIGDGMTVGDKRRKAVEKDLRALGAHKFVDDFVRKYGESFQLTQVTSPAKPAEGASAIGNQLPDAPSGSSNQPPEGGSHQGLTGTQQVNATTQPLPALSLAPLAPDVGRKSGRAAPRRAVPEDWQPSAACLATVAASGVAESIALAAVPEFIDHWRGEGKLKADWDATFRNRIRTLAAQGRLPSPILPSRAAPAMGQGEQSAADIPMPDEVRKKLLADPKLAGLTGVR